MTIFPPVASFFRIVRSLFWVVLAGLVSVIIATESVSTSGTLIGVITLLVLSLITPFAPLTALLVIAPVRTLFATESSVQIPLDFGQWLLIAALAAWIAHAVIFHNRLPRLRVTLPLVAVSIFGIASALSAFSAYSSGAWLTEWLKWMQIAALILLVADLGRYRAWEWILFAIVMSGATNAVIGIYEFFGGSGADHLLIRPEWDFFRAFGTFGQPNPFGGFMGLIAPLAAAATLGYTVQTLNQYFVTRIIAWRSALSAFFYASCTALISIALFMSWSRGAWLGFGVSMLVIVFAAPRNLKGGFALLGAMLVLGAVAWASGRLPTSIVERIQSASQETFSFSDVRGVDINPENYPLVERLAHWQAAINMGTAHPFLGVGLGNYEAAYPDFRLIYWKYPLGHAHNYYLNVFAETGMIGVISYVSMWLVLFVVTWRTTRRQPDPLSRFIAVGLLGTWTYLAIHSLTDNLYVNNLFIHIGIMLGILGVLSDPIPFIKYSKRIAWRKPTLSI